MIKIIAVPIIFKFKIGNNEKWKRSKRMAEVSIKLQAKLTKFSKAYTFMRVSWASFILAVRQLFE